MSVWTPDRSAGQSRLAAFCLEMGVETRRDLDQLARREPERFWERSAAWLGMAWEQVPERTFRPTPQPRGTWFDGGHIDSYTSLIGRHVGSREVERAISWEAEDGTTGGLDFGQLSIEVARVGGGLQDLGVGPGDRVAIQLPMSAEAVVSLVAILSIGAVAVPLYTGFSAGAAAQRIAQCEANVLIASTGFRRRGRWLRGPWASGADAAVPNGLQVVLVEHRPSSQGTNDAAIGWDRLQGDAFEPRSHPSEAPALIAYTSGTTGRPKGVVLPAAGLLAKTGIDVAWLFDVGPSDRAAWITDPGWIMGPILVFGTLMAGGTLGLYDGAPDWPDADRVWRFVRDHRISMLGVSPTLVRSLMGGPGPEPDLTQTLRVLASSGEPWTPDAFEWLFDRVGRRSLPIINYSGGTEVCGAILTNTVDEPIGVGTFAGPVPGMAADVVDAQGRSVQDMVGELVLAHPSPAMATTFWGEHERYAETYWSRLPGVWLHGDWATAREDGPWEIHGRSDDTIKIAGRRIGPAEVEAAVNNHPRVRESAAVGIPDDRTGQRLMVFAAVVEVPASAEDRQAVEDDIAGLVAAGLGRPFRPSSVALTSMLPKTRSGKIMRRVVRAVATGEADLGDLGALEDPVAIDAVVEAVRRTGERP